MALTETRHCIFCGKPPDTKTREHVVPYWLLEMTGDPRRVVTFGQNFARNKAPIRYSWSNFVAPACDACNNEYADLEGRVKPSIEALQRREPLALSSYVELLDWLDKIRVGVWLVNHMIEEHPVKITPHFHIASRVAQKDRMVAVYVFDGDNRGINLFGSDSLIFNAMPSCFGLRINNLLLLSASADFFCSEGCGFPHPVSLKMLMGGDNDGQLSLEGAAYARDVANPITALPLFKPVVWLYQPIKLPSADPMFQGGYYGHFNGFDSRLMERTLPINPRQGALFRQHPDHVQVLRDPSALIALNEVVGDDCAMINDIAASVYDTQVSLYRAIERIWIDPARPTDFDVAFERMKFDNATGMAEMYRRGGNTPET